MSFLASGKPCSGQRSTTLRALESESSMNGGRFAFAPETGVLNHWKGLQALAPPFLSPVLTVLSEMSPATCPAGLLFGDFYVFLRDTGWEDVGAVLHRRMQLQQDNVTSLGVESVVVFVNDDLLH